MEWIIPDLGCPSYMIAVSNWLKDYVIQPKNNHWRFFQDSLINSSTTIIKKLQQKSTSKTSDFLWMSQWLHPYIKDKQQSLKNCKVILQSLIKIKMDKDPLVINNKSCKTYFLIEGSKVYFTGDFDSGNLEKAQQLSPYVYRVTPGFDKTRNSTRKTFFHFKTHGFKHCTVKFIVSRVYLLEQFIRNNDETSEVYHPVARRHSHLPFQKVKQDVKLYYNYADEPELSFSFTFEQENWVEFAFTYPYSYEDCESLISSLALKYRKHAEIYFHDEVLCRTSETRKVHLITITDRRNIGTQKEPPIEGIFEEGAERPFKIDKPRIIISARVHPGQTPASFCMEGIIKFLLNEKDYRSYLLRKNFHFTLIPMLNPEGVFEGMFRNDLNGENLNRMYIYCDPKKHKSIWSVKKYLQSLEKVDFFFDLHAHPSRKGFFIYGNALQEFLQQVEAQIFSKMIEYNCPYFENLDCIYSEKAMTAKDKHDNFTKEGCARVFYHNLFKMIHSYTVQCGYFSPIKLNPYPPQRQFTIPGSEYVCTLDWQSFSTKEYTPQSYMMLGKSLLISIIDIFHINPYTRISTSDFKSINCLRKFTAQRVYNEVERFRLVDSNCYRKIREIAKLIQQNYYFPRFKAYGLTISQNYGMKYRKKSFSINTRLYRQNKSVHQKKQVKDAESAIDKDSNNQSNRIIIPLRSMSDKRIGMEFKEGFSRYPKDSIEMQRKSKLSNAERLLENDNSYPKAQTAPVKRKQFSFSKFATVQKVEEPSRFKKMEEEIIAELLQSKLKSQVKRSSQELLKIDRLGSFLRRQGKTLKLPHIHPDKGQENNKE